MGERKLQILVDLDRYPLDAPDSTAYLAIVNSAQDELRKDGCAVIRGMICSDALLD